MRNNGLVVSWLGRRTCDQQVASTSPCNVLPGWYLNGLVACGRINDLGT